MSAETRLPGDAELFFEPLVARYVDIDRLVGRDWLRARVEREAQAPATRFLLLVGEPGAGKTGLMAGLARAHPDWLRYFIRSDSTTPLSGGDAVGFLLRVGHQLAHLQPDAFDPERISLEVTQRVARGQGDVTGVRIEDLRASPFHTASIKVKQDVGELSGALNAIEIGRATLEPHLIEPDTLGRLALLEPAAVLLRDAPAQRVVVLLDALDEVTGLRGGVSIFDWLEQCPESPANVCFVISSRPHPRLDGFAGAREGQVATLRLDALGADVQRDAQDFAARLLDELQLPADAVAREQAVIGLAQAAAGNFAYLTAYARAVQDAAQAGRAEALAELLEFKAAPSGLQNLYVQFARRIRRNVDQLGSFPVAQGDAGERVPAWEGAGQPLLGILCVAQAPLPLPQLMRLGGARVWPSAAQSVLQCLAPFLEQTAAGWTLFHASVGEFLRSPQAAADAWDVALDPLEWHQRIVAHYQGATAWEQLDWDAMDDYGLRHLPAHVDASSARETAVADLVTARLRNALRKRFFTDLPFTRVLAIARERVAASRDLAVALPVSLFLELVANATESGGKALEPAVFGLMAAHGRVEEALARAQVSPPSMHRFRALQAIRVATPAARRGLLGARDGVEMLVAAAIAIPATHSPIVGRLNYDRSICLGDAAQALAPLDRDHALRLAELADSWLGADHHGARDSVRRTIARAEPARASEVMAQLSQGRTRLAIELAGALPAGPGRESMVDVAFASLEHLDDDADFDGAALAQLVALIGREATDERLPSLLAGLESSLTDEHGAPGRVECAEIAESLREVAPALAERFAALCERPLEKTDGADLVRAAAVSARAGRIDDCRRRVSAALPALRALGWYGPARDIAAAASTVSAFDKPWSEDLLAEAMALVEPAVAAADEFDAGRLDGVLAGMFRALRHDDVPRALALARMLGRGWIHGAEWDSPDGRDTALALVGLDVLAGDPTLSATLLDECLASARRGAWVGRPKGSTPGGLFRTAEQFQASARGGSQQAFFGAYVHNSVNYWKSGLRWRSFERPADVLRSMDAVYPDTASWGRAVAHAIPALAAHDVDEAAAVACWIADPAERLLAMASLAQAFALQRDGRWAFAQEGLAAALRALPRYVPGVALGQLPEVGALSYLDPGRRARFESALLAAGPGAPVDVLPHDATVPATFHGLVHAQSAFDDVLAGRYDHLDPAALWTQLDALAGRHETDAPPVADLLRWAGVQALARTDPGAARECAATLASPAMRLQADAFLLARGERVDSPLQRLQDLLQAADDIAVLSQHAHAATLGARWLSLSGTDAAALLDSFDAQLAQADAWSACRTLLELLPLAPAARQVAMLQRIASLAPGVSNTYQRDDILADALGPALATGDAGIAVLLLARLRGSGWFHLCEGLRRAAPRLVEAGGLALLQGIDAAMRRAQSVIGRPDGQDRDEDLDGVLAAPDRAAALDRARQDDWPSLYAYLDLFLTDAEMPPDVEQVQDSRLQGPDDRDHSFTPLGGRRTGLVLWLGEEDRTLWRIVDIRWEFPDAEAASRYLSDELPYHGEGQPPLADAPAAGEQWHAFGGVAPRLTAFHYVLRVGRIVAKLFVAQGRAAKTALTLADVHALAEKAAARIAATGA